MPLLFYIITISFIATLIRSTFGFGESLIAVPLFLLFIPLDVAVPLSVLISVFIAAIVVAQDHKEIHVSSAKWLILFAILGIPIGLYILIKGNQYWVKIILGMLIVIYSIYSLLSKRNMLLKQNNRFWLFICGFLSGILGGAYGLNGPPLVIYGNLRSWSAKQFRATLQAYFLPVSLIGVLGYAVKGLVQWAVLKYFLLCLPAIIPAIFLGRYLNHKLHGDRFFRWVYSGLIFIGLLLAYITVLGR